MVWVETGAVGAVLYLVLHALILGVGAWRIMFRIRDPQLKGLLGALLAGAGGMMAGCYANEIMNFPNGPMVYICEAFVFAVTLGYGVDRLLSRLSVISGAEYFITDALASAFAEAACDGAEAEICKGCGGRARFSPGYGDFDIHHQDDILRMLDTAKKIGLTMTDSYMLTPTKSVTAIIGISDTQEKCHIKGCEVCEKKDCIYRRN